MLNGTLASRPGRVAVVAAGTSDASVAAEAARTLTFSGVECQVIVDVGVAGLWRLEARLDEIRAADIVIAVAGMDAALVSVLGGLVAAPVIAVPTSVGYGVATGGHRGAPQRTGQLRAGGRRREHRQRIRRGVRRRSDALAGRWFGLVTIGWIDGTAGASGDMLLGALVDAGVPLEVMQRRIDRLGLDIALRAEPVRRGGLGATKVHVDVPVSDVVRHLPQIVELLDGLDDPIRRRSVAVFERLATAEASVHRTSVDEVHFHEVGALDSIADVVGVCAGFVELDLDAVWCSTLSLGSGSTRGAHGPIPVPAPAVLAVLDGIGHVAGGSGSVRIDDTDGGGTARRMGRRVGSAAGDDVARSRDGCRYDGHRRRRERVSSGRGRTDRSAARGDDPDRRERRRPRPARVAVGDRGGDDRRCGRRVGHADRDEEGPTCAHVQRPVLTDAGRSVRSAIFRETTTIGLREYPVHREVLERVESTVDVDGAEIRVKTAWRNGEIVNRSVEWDDVVAAARSSGRPPNDVLAEASARLAPRPEQAERQGLRKE